MDDNKQSLWESRLVIKAIYGALAKLNPISTLRNPVMLVVEIGAVITTLITVYNISTAKPFGFNLQISVWLFFTVIFAKEKEKLRQIL